MSQLALFRSEMYNQRIRMWFDEYEQEFDYGYSREETKFISELFCLVNEYRLKEFDENFFEICSELVKEYSALESYDWQQDEKKALRVIQNALKYH